METWQKFGLSTLSPSTQSSSSDLDQKNFENDSLIVIGGALLNLAKDEDSVQLHDVVKTMKLDLDVLLPVVHTLEKRGLIEIVEKHSLGNHTLRLTPKGQSEHYEK